MNTQRGSEVRKPLATKIFFVLSREGLISCPFKFIQGEDLFDILSSIREEEAVLWQVDEHLAEDVGRLSPFIPNAVVLIPSISPEVYPPWFVHLKMHFQTITTTDFEKQVSEFTQTQQDLSPAERHRQAPTSKIIPQNTSVAIQKRRRVPEELLPSENLTDF